MPGIIISMNAGPLEELAIITDQKILAVWSLDCAEHVLPVFEEKYPSDPRPRDAIEAGRSWLRGEIKVGEARKAAFLAHAAARSAAGDPPASFAARAAGHAAATAHTSGHAIHAADYAVKAMPANLKIQECEWQYKHLLQLISKSHTPDAADT